MTLKGLATCPDCNLSMTDHTLKYIHKKEDIVKEHFKKKKLNKNSKKKK